MQGRYAVHLIEDDESQRSTLANVLTQAGFDPHTYASAQQFLRECNARRAHMGCVLIDLDLPGNDARELQSELKRQRVELPVLLISGHADVATAVEVMRAGAVDLLEKPINAPDLIHRIRVTLASQEQQLEARESLDSVRRLLDSLSPREHDVLDEILNGKTNKQISSTLDIGIQTVAKHKARVLKKLHVKNDLELMLLLAGKGIEPAAQG